MVDIIDASDDEQTLLLIASSDTDPGMIYRFEKASNRLEQILPLREELEGMPMGKMTPVSYPAADGTMIPAYLTLPVNSEGKNLPAIVLPHGGPSSRDEWGFDWMVQFFVHRGYAVLQPNFRGSAGYGSDWFQQNGFKSWRTAIGDVNDAGHWLVKEGIADKDRLNIVGWSYGGYAALQSAVLDHELYGKIVVIAPVTDLEQLRYDSQLFTNYKLVESFIGESEHVATGSPAEHADAFQAPVLLFHGDLDTNVNVDQSRRMQQALQSAGKSVEYVEYENLDHALDRGAARSEMLIKIDRFLNQN